MDRYVFPILAQCDIVTVMFDLWMLRMGFDTFALIMNFLNWEWFPCEVTIGLFEPPNTSGIALAEIIKPLLAKFELTNKVIACVKEKGKNLATLNSSLPDVVSCRVFQLERHYGKSSLQRLDWHAIISS